VSFGLPASKLRAKLTSFLYKEDCLKYFIIVMKNGPIQMGILGEYKDIVYSQCRETKIYALDYTKIYILEILNGVPRMSPFNSSVSFHYCDKITAISNLKKERFTLVIGPLLWTEGVVAGSMWWNKMLTSW
jgi:hypothetical protein